MEILAELALQSRLQGFRDVPIDAAKEILQKYEWECIARLCQGPVAFIDGEFIKFRHETFQEYLCAEKLVRQPELLKFNISKARYNAIQWGMPLAYAVELCWPLPEPLWRAAWAVDPWMGWAVTDKERAAALKSHEDSFFIKKHIFIQNIQLKTEFGWETADFLKRSYTPCDAIISILLYPNIRKLFLHPDDSSLSKKEAWYKLKEYLAYLIAVNKEIEYKWAIIELLQLVKCARLSTICSVLKRALTLKVNET